MSKTSASTILISEEARELAGKVRRLAADNTTTAEAKILSREKLTNADESTTADLLNMFVRVSRVVRKLTTNRHRLGALAAKMLVEQTYANIEQIHKVPVQRMKPIAAPLPKFPVLASRQPQSSKTISAQLLRLDVGETRLPGYKPEARWKHDDFGDIAEQIVFQLMAGDPDGPVRAIGDWSHLNRKIRRDILPGMLGDKEYTGLASQIKARGDLKFASRVKERIRGRILDRVRAILGLCRSQKH